MDILKVQVSGAVHVCAQGTHAVYASVQGGEDGKGLRPSASMPRCDEVGTEAVSLKPFLGEAVPRCCARM